MQSLYIHSNYLRENNLVKLIIQGHTDEIGTSEYNIALAEKRANFVKTFLHLQGVSYSQIYIVSYGKEIPIDLEHTNEAYKKNRRVVLIYIKE